MIVEIFMLASSQKKINIDTRRKLDNSLRLVERLCADTAFSEFVVRFNLKQQHFILAFSFFAKICCMFSL